MKTPEGFYCLFDNGELLGFFETEGEAKRELLEAAYGRYIHYEDSDRFWLEFIPSEDFYEEYPEYNIPA